ncbi:MAG: phosphatidylglycerol lysyltransferase domain-containing protein [Candidatus Margulisbacteria bacterium]|nr:phosphatidylglycerol lysyltransferase domain-containing protein [Candidatus Margulisiibacteriota bacterium]
MLPKYPQFKPLAIDDLPEITKRLNEYLPSICELSPSNLIIWQDFDRPQVALLNDNLCILICAINGESFFLEPIGKHALKETVKTCLEYCKKLSHLSEYFLKGIDVSAYKVKCLRNQFDYIYGVQKLAELRGRRFDGKRNHIKSFKKRHPNYEFLPLDINDKSDALMLFERWFGAKKEISPLPQLAYSSQINALSRAFDNYNVLGLRGAKVIVYNKLAAFIIGSRLNNNTITVHFQYTDPDFRGVSQILLWEACCRTFNSYKFINLEQDLGIAGIRKAKLSYYPDKLEKKYEVTLSPRCA